MADTTSIRKLTKFGYGVGHILNDLCASMWFTYLLLFFHKIVEFDNVYSGIVLFIGQIADGLSTVFVGFSSDRGDDFRLCLKFGRRKSWHMLGTVCILFTFPFIFLKCVNCEDSDQYAQMIYYSGFVIIFQFGWAAVQISHLAMIPELTDSSDQRAGLTALRNAASVLSNITVYLIAWLFLGIRVRPDGDEMIGPEDVDAFRNIALVCLAIGGTSSVIFHCLVPHKEEEPQPNVIEPRSASRQKLSVVEWLSQPQLYQVAVVYLTTRLFVNLSQAYIPLYLQVTLRLPATSIATVPLVMFLSGLVTSLILERTKSIISRKVTFPIGAILGMTGCMWVFFGCQDSVCLPESDYSARQIYGIAAFMGAGGSTMLVASLSLTADFIGPDTQSAAFIYGFMSLTDKVCNGVAVVVIQNFVPVYSDECADCRGYFRSVVVWGLGAACLIGLLALLTLLGSNMGRRRGLTTATRVEEPTERTSLLHVQDEDPTTA